MESLLTITDFESQKKAFREFFATEFQKPNPDFAQFFKRVLVDNVLPVHKTRDILDDFVKAFAEKSNSLPPNQFSEIGAKIMSQFQDNGLFKEQNKRIRQIVAEAYQMDGNFTEAANLLSPIDLELFSSASEKCEHLVLIAQLHLADEKVAHAQQYLAKAATYISNVTDSDILVKYELSSAQIADYNRKFLEASKKFYELSHKVIESEQLQNLNNAIVCALLADAGSQRSRMLTTLFKDENAKQLDIFAPMEKMFLGRILREHEIQKLDKHLKEHHKALTGDGYTVLQKALIQHNLLAASKIYVNITIPELGILLGIEPAKAEKIAAKMINENRLSGHIDQLDEVLYFEDDAMDVQTWDGMIEDTCRKITGVIEAINEEEAKPKEK